MKNIYTLLCFTLVIGISFGQVEYNYPPVPKHCYIGQQKVKPAQPEASNKVVLWANDFSVPADWILWDNSIPQASWEIVTNPSLPSFSFASMTTTANGFALVNSDAQGPGATQDCYLEYSGEIDCSGLNNVSIQFEQMYQNYQGLRSLQVSTNGGSTWTDYFITDLSTPMSSKSGVETINISQVASNEPQVKLRFHYMASDGWYWAIDDLYLIETEPYDLKAESTNWGSIGNYGKIMSYYEIPISMVQPIEFCGIISNIGVNDVLDATYSVNVSGSGTFNSNDSKVIISDDQDTICATTNFVPDAGYYTIEQNTSTANTETGGILNNDFEGFNIDVNTANFAKYSRDNVNAGFQGGIYNRGNSFEVGNVFDVTEITEPYLVNFDVHPSTVPGGLIYMNLYEIDGLTGDLVLIDRTDYYQIVPLDIGNTVSLILLNPPVLINPGSYLVTVVSGDEVVPPTDVVVGTSGYSSPETSLFYDRPDDTWYYTSNTPKVSMTLKQNNIGVGEFQQEILSVYPNPAVNTATVSFALNNTSDVVVNVTDLSGKVVCTTSLANAAAGSNSVDVNTSSLTNGVYMVNVVTNEAVSTQKLVIKK